MNRVLLCAYISHVEWNTGDTDVMIYYISTNIHISILLSYLHYVWWNSVRWHTIDQVYIRGQHTYLSLPYPWHPVLHLFPTNVSRLYHVPPQLRNKEAFFRPTKKYTILIRLYFNCNFAVRSRTEYVYRQTPLKLETKHFENFLPTVWFRTNNTPM
jgi:hypothetical protein